MRGKARKQFLPRLSGSLINDRIYPAVCFLGVGFGDREDLRIVIGCGVDQHVLVHGATTVGIDVYDAELHRQRLGVDELFLRRAEFWLPYFFPMVLHGFVDYAFILRCKDKCLNNSFFLINVKVSEKSVKIF